MFFESVPDEFVDIKLDKWHFDEATHTIPIIIPRNYLNLYNFGFAQSRSLPKLSEGLMSLIQMDIMMRGNGRVEQYKGNIVGFSNRLNTILVRIPPLPVIFKRKDMKRKTESWMQARLPISFA